MPLYFSPTEWTETFGGNSTGTGTTAFYLPAGYYPSSMGGLISPFYFAAPRDVIADRLRVYIDSAHAGNSLTFTLHAGNAGSVSATALTCTLAAAAQSGSDLTHEVSIDAGQLYTIQVTFGGALSGAAARVGVSVRFRAR